VASRLAGCSSGIGRSAHGSKPKLMTSCSPGPMEPLTVCGWRGCASTHISQASRSDEAPLARGYGVGGYADAGLDEIGSDTGENACEKKPA
jgi:hypothetical protein